MPTARDHMAADMAWLFAQDGEEVRDVVINGVTVRAIVQEVDMDPGSYGGAIVQQKTLFLLPNAIVPLPRPGGELTVDGETWSVAAQDQGPLLNKIVLERYIS